MRLGARYRHISSLDLDICVKYWYRRDLSDFMELAVLYYNRNNTLIDDRLDFVRIDTKDLWKWKEV